MTTIMLVEDDPAISEHLARSLAREGYQVRSYGTGKGAMRNLEGVDLLILDLGLPDMDGLEVTKEIRQVDTNLPILILTARASEVDMVTGLDLGADDYVVKPFRSSELLARIRALLRRNTNEDLISVQDIVIDLAAHKVYQAKEEISLTTIEFQLLEILMRNAGKMITRQELVERIWGKDKDDSSIKSLDMHISWLRKKIKDSVTNPRYINTIRSLGFRFEES